MLSPGRPEMESQVSRRMCFFVGGHLTQVNASCCLLLALNCSARGNWKAVYQLRAKSRLQDGTEPAIFVPKLLRNMTIIIALYSGDNFSEYSWVLVLFLDWIITIGNSSSASTKICQKQHLFHRLCVHLWINLRPMQVCTQVHISKRATTCDSVCPGL